MSKQLDGGPAFPHTRMHLDGAGTISYGMTLRQYAAIKLRVPDSGTPWLDDMIRASQREELAAKAMQGFAARGNTGWRGAYEWADAMLAARSKGGAA